MNPDDLQQAWQGQPRPTLDAGLLLKEVQRNERSFNAMIFWRDFREVGISLVMVPLWFTLGARNALPWAWYLTVPALLWVAGYLLIDRVRHKRRPPEPAGSLRQSVEVSLTQVDHQIGLLRNVHLWGLLPLALAMLAFFGQVAWREQWGVWWMALPLLIVVALGMGVFATIYWLNLYAIQHELEPRRRELQALLISLEDETRDAG